MARVLFVLGALAVSGDQVQGCAAGPVDAESATVAPPAERAAASQPAAPLPVEPLPDEPLPASPPTALDLAQPLVVIVDVSPSMAGRMERARANVAALLDLAAVEPQRPVQILTFTGAPARWQEWTPAAALHAAASDRLPSLDWCDRSYPPFTDDAPSSQLYAAFSHASPGVQRCSDGAVGLPWMDGGSHPAAALDLALDDLEAAGVPEAQLVLLTDPSGPRCTSAPDDCTTERVSALEAVLERLDTSPHSLGVVGLRRDRDTDEKIEAFRARYGDRIIAMPRVDH